MGGSRSLELLHVNFASTAGCFGPWSPRRDVSYGGELNGGVPCKGIYQVLG